MKRSTWKLTMILMGILLISFAVPAITSASSQGGKDIASATPVIYGQQEFGNTAQGHKLPDSCFLGFYDYYYQFWMLNVSAGDQVTIDWGGVEGTELRLYPVGTTDYTVFSSGNEPAATQDLNANGKNQMQYTVPVSGAMPLEFSVCEEEGPPGPYNFVATIQHGLALSLDNVIQIGPQATLTGHASLLDGTPVPDGLNFVLVARWNNEVVGRYEAASAGGGLSFPVSLPEAAWGHTVSFVLKRPADAQYLEAKSAPMKVKVTKPIYCAVPSLVGKTLKQAKRSLQRSYCQLGKVKRSRSRSHPKRVIRQKPKPGTVLPEYSKVSVVIG